LLHIKIVNVPNIFIAKVISIFKIVLQHTESLFYEFVGYRNQSEFLFLPYAGKRPYNSRQSLLYFLAESAHKYSSFRIMPMPVLQILALPFTPVPESTIRGHGQKQELACLAESKPFMLCVVAISTVAVPGPIPGIEVKHSKDSFSCFLGQSFPSLPILLPLSSA
jgi:hypothetical protein